MPDQPITSTSTAPTLASIESIGELWTKAIARYESNTSRTITEGPQWDELIKCKTPKDMYNVVKQRAESFEAFRSSGAIWSILSSMTRLVDMTIQVAAEGAAQVRISIL